MRFEPSLRRPNRVGTVVLISGANYGLGSAMGDPDWNSSGELYDTSARNSLLAVDGRASHTPFADQITYVTIAAAHDYPQTLYERGGGHPEGFPHTSSLLGAIHQRVGPAEGLGYPDRALVDGNLSNHRRLVRDPDVFARYVLPHLTGADVHN